MLTDPQSITVGGSAKSFPRTGIGAGSADYTTSDGTYRFRVSQSSNSKTRRTAVSLQINKIAADPLTAVNQRVTAQLSVAFITPTNGFTIAELTDAFTGVSALLNASSSAKLVQILGGEK